MGSTSKRRVVSASLLLFLSAVTWFLPPLCAKAFALAPDEITVHKALVLSDIITDYDHGFTIYETEGGQVVYSADVTAEPTPNNTTLELLDAFDPGLQYIMTNGYPYTSITGNDEADMCITQAVVWRYVDDEHVSQEFKNAVETDPYRMIDGYISPLLSDARTKSEEYSDVEAMQEDQFIDLPSSDSGHLSVSEDEMYFESPFMFPGVEKTNSYSVGFVEALEGAEVLDDRNTVRYTFDSDEGFRIRIPASSLNDVEHVKIVISCEAVLPYVGLYGDPNDPSAERFVYLSENPNGIIDKEMLLSIERPNVNIGLKEIFVLVVAVVCLAILGFFAMGKWKCNKNAKKSPENSSGNKQS